MNDYRAVIFDLDGTLYRMNWYLRPLIFALTAPRSTWLPRFMKVRETFAGKEFPAGDALLDALCRSFAKRYGCPDGEVKKWYLGRFYPAFVSTLSLMRDSRPGLNELLQTLRGRKVRLGVISDFSRIRERLIALKINPSLFDEMVSCEEAGALKPSPRPFIKMAAGWNLPPGEVLVAGDRDDTDGAVARACGMGFRKIADGDRSGEVAWVRVREELSQLNGAA